MASEQPDVDESGFGLVEVVVSMFLIAVVAMGMLTFLIQGLKVSADNTNLATGTQLVAQQLELARAASGSCASLRNFAGTAPAAVVDGRGASFQPTRSPITCPTTFPAIVSFTTTVVFKGKVISEATTRILVVTA
jgi:Tfp pilus assembly protein PilV